MLTMNQKWAMAFMIAERNLRERPAVQIINMTNRLPAPKPMPYNPVEKPVRVVKTTEQKNVVGQTASRDLNAQKKPESKKNDTVEVMQEPVISERDLRDMVEAPIASIDFKAFDVVKNFVAPQQPQPTNAKTILHNVINNGEQNTQTMQAQMQQQGPANIEAEVVPQIDVRAINNSITSLRTYEEKANFVRECLATDKFPIIDGLYNITPADKKERLKKSVNFYTDGNKREIYDLEATALLAVLFHGNTRREIERRFGTPDRVVGLNKYYKFVEVEPTKYPELRREGYSWIFEVPSENGTPVVIAVDPVPVLYEYIDNKQTGKKKYSWNFKKKVLTGNEAK